MTKFICTDMVKSISHCLKVHEKPSLRREKLKVRLNTSKSSEARHKSCDGHKISDRTQNFLTKGYFHIVAQTFSNVKNFGDQILLI